MEIKKERKKRTQETYTCDMNIDQLLKHLKSRRKIKDSE